MTSYCGEHSGHSALSRTRFDPGCLSTTSNMTLPSSTSIVPPHLSHTRNAFFSIPMKPPLSNDLGNIAPMN